MECDFDYCIYNRNFKCTLQKTSINNLGMCEECIVTKLDRVFLESEKEKQLYEIENKRTE